MNTFFKIVFAFCAAFNCIGNAGDPPKGSAKDIPVQWGETYDGFALGIGMDRRVYKTNENCEVTIHLKNRSQLERSVMRSDSLLFLEFDLRDEEGNAISRKHPIVSGYIIESHSWVTSISLKPEKIFREERILNQNFNLKPGRYQMTLKRWIPPQNPEMADPKSPTGHYIGVKSNKLEFELMDN